MVVMMTLYQLYNDFTNMTLFDFLVELLLIVKIY